jgi:hypothetical protein
VLEGFQFQAQGGEGQPEVRGVDVNNRGATNMWGEKLVGSCNLIGGDHGILFRRKGDGIWRRWILATIALTTASSLSKVTI